MDIDLALADRSRKGDREAFEELVRRSARALFAHLYLETADAHLAEDLSQETFLKAWRSIRSLADPAGFRAWLFSIAHSVLIGDIRRRSRRKRRGDRAAGELSSTIISSGPSPHESADLRDQRGRVLSALRSMPREYRMPLMLRYLSGADYETIARELAITNGSLRGLLHRGLAMLRKQLTSPASPSPSTGGEGRGEGPSSSRSSGPPLVAAREGESSPSSSSPCPPSVPARGGGGSLSSPSPSTGGESRGEGSSSSELQRGSL